MPKFSLRNRPTSWSLAMVLALVVTVVMHTRAAADDPFVIAAFGDSLAAGYGLADEHTFPVQLETALTDNGHAVRVINAGVSGDTTAGGVARLDWTLADNPDLVILELGANDGLRGIDPVSTRANLDTLLDRLQARNVPVLLAGMYAPPNLGAEYGSSFNSIYPDLSEKYGVALMPFFLEDVAAEPHLNQSDGIHPNADGVAVIVDNIIPLIEPFLVGGAEGAV